MVAAGGAVFLVVELTFLMANLTKFVEGGWLPLLVAAVVFTVLMTWQRGQVIVTRRRRRTADEGALTEFLHDLHTMDPPIHRVPRTAVFLNATPDTTPLALRANVEHNHALQRRVIIMNTQVHNIPYVAREYRLIVDDVRYEAEGITHLHASFGFQDEPNVPAVLRQAVANGFLAEADLQELTYFLSRIAIVGSPKPSMPAWQTRLFLTVAHNAANPAEYFGLPVERPIGIGAQIPL